MRVLHVLANSSPDVNGYAVRTHGLLKAYAESGQIEPIALTSPWYPQRESMAEPTEVDDITYHRCLHPSRMKSTKGTGMKWTAARGRDRITGSEGFAAKPLWRRALHFALKPLRPGWYWVEERILFKHFTDRIIEVAKAENAEIIHAHVPYRVGIPAMKAARILNLPFVYEMRGMWEETAVANGRWKPWGPAYRRFRHLETKVLRKADEVICISETLRNEAISRGVDPNRISLVPNAVTLSESEGISNLLPLAESKLGQSVVVGYIGSLRDIEGVDATAEAVALLTSQGLDVKLFVLSSKAGQEELKSHCESLDIGDNTVIMGPVPHEEVAPFYDLIDIFVVSRPDTRVTRFVTPLKPFEAMQRGRALVMSDLPALLEIVEHGVTGLLYPPGDIEALSKTILSLIENETLRIELGQNAKDWVEENRTWATVIDGALDAYQRVTQK